jgi:hypothetical protein
MEGVDAPVILSFMATFMARSSSDWALNSSGVDFLVISTGFGVLLVGRCSGPCGFGSQ